MERERTDAKRKYKVRTENRQIPTGEWMSGKNQRLEYFEQPARHNCLKETIGKSDFQDILYFQFATFAGDGHYLG
jgi:hypothetical protein